GGILTVAADIHGRPVSYVFLEADLPNGSSAAPNEATLRRSLNFQMLSSGMAYLLTYRSMPEAHRSIFREAARNVLTARNGVYAIDETADFVLIDESSIGRGGACIFPKLFRRCIDYLKARRQGFTGELKEWVLATSTNPARNENDRVLIWNEANPASSVQTL